MAGGRKGRRKPGHGEGDNEAARDGQNAMAAHVGREKASETADVEAEQWLNPFRIGRPVTPVISHRQGIDDLPGSQLPRRPARGEPIRAVPVEAVPADEAPVQGVPVQIWHEPPPEDWQSGQQPPGGPVRYGDPRGYRGPHSPSSSREGSSLPSHLPGGLSERRARSRRRPSRIPVVRLWRRLRPRQRLPAPGELFRIPACRLRRSRRICPAQVRPAGRVRPARRLQRAWRLRRAGRARFAGRLRAPGQRRPARPALRGLARPWPGRLRSARRVCSAGGL
jgi:hypothetical protein